MRTRRSKHGSAKKDAVAVLLDNARGRARRKGVPFSITREDIVIPRLCPVLGILLRSSRNGPGPNSPSLDRIDPKRGYVPGNVIVVSHKANCIKSYGTPDDLERVASFYRQLSK